MLSREGICAFWWGCVASLVGECCALVAVVLWTTNITSGAERARVSAACNHYSLDLSRTINPLDPSPTLFHATAGCSFPSAPDPSSPSSSDAPTSIFASTPHTQSAETAVHSAYYRLSSEYYKAVGPPDSFYRSALMFLAYTPLESIPQADRYTLATDISLAALTGEGVFNFGEVVRVVSFDLFGVDVLMVVFVVGGRGYDDFLAVVRAVYTLFVHVYVHEVIPPGVVGTPSSLFCSCSCCRGGGGFDDYTVVVVC